MAADTHHRRGGQGDTPPNRRDDAASATLRRRMFFRIALGALMRSRGRLLIALASVLIGAATVSAMSNVFLDLQDKLSLELRKYGANMAVVPSGDSGFTDEQFKRALAQVQPGKLVGAAPYVFGIGDARANAKSERIVIAGTDPGEALRVAPYWRVEGRMPKSDSEAVLGAEAASALSIGVGDTFVLSGPANPVSTDAAPAKSVSPTACSSCHGGIDRIHRRVPSSQRPGVECGSCHRPHPTSGPGTPQRVTVTGVLTTGGDEEAQVILPLAHARKVLSKPKTLDAAFLSVIGQEDETNRLARAIAAANLGVQAKPVKRVAQSEGRVLLKLSSLFSLVVGIVLAGAALCVGITMMAMVLERRREVGLKKALGAEDRLIAAEFLGEAVAFGLLGGILGWGLGFGLAQWIGQSVFGSSIALSAVTIPLTLIVSLFMTVAAAFVPVRVASGIDPAIVLKEE